MPLVVGGRQYSDVGETIGENETAAMFLGFGIVLLLLGIGSILKPLILQNLLVRLFCNSLTIKGRIESDRLLQNQMKAPGRGEGLADALDIDGF